MTPDLLAALMVFAFAMSITPGPNNLMLMASGANFGLRRTLPHLAGVGFGVVVLISAIGAGLSGILALHPLLPKALEAAGALYMLWLAWRIARAAAPEPGAPPGRPMTFIQALAFQWVNPKAWAMSLSALTLYAPSNTFGAIALVAIVFGAVNMPSVGVWVVLGVRLRRWLGDPRHLRAFNVGMALLLVASLIPILID